MTSYFGAMCGVHQYSTNFNLKKNPENYVQAWEIFGSCKYNIPLHWFSTEWRNNFWSRDYERPKRVPDLQNQSNTELKIELLKPVSRPYLNKLTIFNKLRCNIHLKKSVVVDAGQTWSRNLWWSYPQEFWFVTSTFCQFEYYIFPV